MSTRLLGILRARQRERGRTVRHDRIIACAETDAAPARFKSYYTAVQRAAHRHQADEA